MADPDNIMKPLVGFDAWAHRSGLGILKLQYLPAVPGSALSEDEARRAILSLQVTLTESMCATLSKALGEMATELAKTKAARN